MYFLNGVLFLLNVEIKHMPFSFLASFNPHKKAEEAEAPSTPIL